MSTLPPPGSIGLVSVRGLTGLLIRLGQFANGDGWANYEHAFVLVDTPTAALADAVIVEAQPDGCRRTALAEYRGRKILWLPCPDDSRAGVVSAAESYVDSGYSVLDYFAIAARRIDLPGRDLLRRRVDFTNRQICSSMADAAASRGGWELFRGGQWPGYVTPALLATKAPPGARPELLA